MYRVKSDIRKECPGAKHLGRWENAEYKMPSVKMFKTNTNGHKHPSISLFIIEQDTVGEPNQRKQVAFNTGTVQSLKTVL